MKGLHMRNYHLFIFSLICIILVLINRKFFPDSETIKISSDTLTALLRRTTSYGNTSEPIQAADNIHVNLQRTTDITITTVDTIQDRLTRVASKCLHMNISTTGLALEITGDKDRKFAYCVVPKAGCTMWQRVLKYLAGQRGATQDLMSLSKYHIHYKGIQFRHVFTMKNNNDFLANSLRSMTVRNPYTRLWSAYIDKLLLPDFWVTKGIMLIKLMRTNATDKSKRCGHDVTFSEFIDYVIKIGHDRKYINQDKHWLPASDICDPCTFKPEVIGKQESFMEDFKLTITRLGIPEILDKILVKDVDDYEIEDEIDYNFNVYKNKCMSIKEVCKRMWTAFQYNGYIPPSEKFENYVQKEAVAKPYFLSAIRNVRSKFNVTRSDKRKWRTDAIRKAYSGLSNVQLENLAKLYKLDFDLFGYNSHPDFL